MSISICIILLIAFVSARELSSYQEYDSGKYITVNRFTSALFISKREISEFAHFGRKIPEENYNKWNLVGFLCYCVLGIILIIGVVFAIIPPIYGELPLTAILNPRDPVEYKFSLNESTVFMLSLLLLCVEGILSCVRTIKMPSEYKGFWILKQVTAVILSIILVAACALVLFFLVLEWNEILF